MNLIHIEGDSYWDHEKEERVRADNRDSTEQDVLKAALAQLPFGVNDDDAVVVHPRVLRAILKTLLEKSHEQRTP